MPRPDARTAVGVALVATLTLTGCVSGEQPPSSSPGPTTPAAAPAATTAATPSGDAGPTFEPCGRTAPDPADTNLAPNPLTDADRARAGWWAEDITDGTLVLEAATALEIHDGILGAGDGYLAAIGSPAGTSRVADATVPDAPVTLSVLDSEQAGRGVAFVEVRLDPTPPVRWVQDPELSFGTDGGDGGFLTVGPSPDVMSPDDQLTVFDDYMAAWFPDYEDPSTWNQCLVRTTGGAVDGVLFNAGWGDGYYSTYRGLDDDGDVVSIVFFGAIVPWGLSGLPGEPPETDRT